MTMLLIVLVLALLGALTATLVHLVRTDGLGHLPPPRSHAPDLFEPRRLA